MATATELYERQILRLRYYARAQRELQEHDRLDYSTQEQIESLAECLRHEDFRRHIRPYLQKKEKLICDFFMLQTSMSAKMPAELERALALWDEMIDSEARKFGYETASVTESGAEHGNDAAP